MHFELAYLQRCNTDRRHGVVALKYILLCSEDAENEEWISKEKLLSELSA